MHRKKKKKKETKFLEKNFRNANESIARKAITLVLIILLQNLRLYTLTALTRSSVFYLGASDTEYDACVFNPKRKVHLERARRGINCFEFMCCRICALVSFLLLFVFIFLFFFFSPARTSVFNLHRCITN